MPAAKFEAIDGFIPAHPGGRLIWSAVGQEATDLFRAHHASKAAEVALEKCFVGHFSTQRPRKRLQARMRMSSFVHSADSSPFFH